VSNLAAFQTVKSHQEKLI